jgi:hypothetical protein
VNKSDLVKKYRIDAEDRVVPYFATTSMIVAWLNEAEEEAAIRAHLLREVSNPELCEIAVTVAGGNTYPLHEAMVWITRAQFIPDGLTAADACPLHLISHTEIDRVFPRWRTTTEQPRYLIVNDTTVQLGCMPLTDGLLQLEGCRVPLDKIEVYDPGRAQKALDEFERMFGARPDGKLRRDIEQDRHHANRAW